MKILKHELFLIILASLFLLFKPNKDNCEKHYAAPYKIQGYYIYVDSEPSGEYEVIGEIKSLMGVSTHYESARDRLIKKAKKKYSKGDGIIFYFDNTFAADRASVIQFKE